MIPLRDFRNWLIDLRANPEAREARRRNGAIYMMSSGDLGSGPFTMETRQEMLRRLLQLEIDTGFDLISEDELKVIDQMWENEGDLSRRGVVDIYFAVKGERLPWDSLKKAKYSETELDLIASLCDDYNVPFDLMSKLMIAVDNTKFYTRSQISAREVEKILNEGWLHFENIQKGLNNENQQDRVI